MVREFAFGIVRRLLRLRPLPQDLRANTLFQPLDHTADSLGTQPDRRHGRNLSGAHALPEVEPEDHAIASLIGTNEHTPQILINLLEKNLERNPFLIAFNSFASLGINVGRGDMRVVAT